jgi:hypothetical protein
LHVKGSVIETVSDEEFGNLILNRIGSRWIGDFARSDSRGCSVHKKQQKPTRQSRHSNDNEVTTL